MGVADRLPYGGEDELIRRVEVLEAQVRAFGAAELLRAAGIVAEADILRVLGNLRVEGTLDLPAGIVGNDALANPVEPDHTTAIRENFALGASWVSILDLNLTVPEGFTSVVLIAQANLRVENTTARDNLLLAEIILAGDQGAAAVDYRGAGATMALWDMQHSTLVSGLTGGDTVTCTIRGIVAVPVTASVDNEARLRVTQIWFR